MSAVLLKFPAHWNGAVNCHPSSFGRGVQKSCAVANCPYYPGGLGEVLCACHKYCQSHCVSGRANNTFTPATWETLVQPYVNASISDDWTLQVFNDCRRKLNGLDPERGVGVFHGLLLVDDDVALCKEFLELGVDPELRYIRSSANAGECDSMDEAAAEELNGGTALHFAARLGRPHCLMALVDAGANLDAETRGGKTPGQLANGDGVIQEIIAAAKAQGRRTVAILAKENKFFGIRFLMRAGRVSGKDFLETIDDKTAVDWIWTAMCSWNFSQDLCEDDLTVFKLMSEIKFRYGLEASKNVSPPIILESGAPDSAAAQLHTTSAELLQEVKGLSKDLKTAVKILARIWRDTKSGLDKKHQFGGHDDDEDDLDY